MSKGGAGKVYFVLYLAVILELLIIIVERDEAEEHLIAKQKESMKIVESILSQLQVGAGTEGINTRPQDQITIPPPGVNVKEVLGGEIKPERRYMIEVGITDVTASLKMNESEEPVDYLERLKRFVRLSNVSDLQYDILYSRSNSDEIVPDSSSFEKKASTELKLKLAEMEQQLEGIFTQYKADPAALTTNIRALMTNATYETPPPTGFKPSRVNDAEFYYSRGQTDSLGAKASKKRVFVVNFEPKEEGWYKLRFSSRTNKVLGVYNPEGSTLDVDPEQKVNIGTVQLKVKDLLKVRDELQKNMGTLPTAEAARTDLRQFDETLQKLKEEAADVDTRSKVDLYGYIVKLVTPGMSDNFDQNRGYIEYNIRVLKPQPQITDPKIADLKTVVRVFDKLSKITLPMQVTPANGQTAILKNPGTATVGGGSGTASVGGSGSKWVNKDLTIPVAGALAPRDEPYIFELVQKNGSKSSEPVQCSVFVYSSKLTNEEEVRNALEASWGDPIEFVATPASGNTIKPDEFVMNFNMGTGAQVQPLRKLAVGASDNVLVPPGADAVNLTILWKDPQSGEVVELFQGKGDVGLKRPMILSQDLKVDPIVNQNDPEFKVRGIIVRPPAISADEKAEVGDVDAQVTTATVRDMRTNQTYKVSVVGKPRKVTGQEYEVTLRLTGGRIPLTKGQVKGNVSLSISATARAQGATSKPRQKQIPLSVSN